jgi:hypothetical protein
MGALQGRSPVAAQVPQHAWEGMAQFAPEAAELACHSLDIASAESYFFKVSPCFMRTAYPPGSECLLALLGQHVAVSEYQMRECPAVAQADWQIMKGCCTHG